MTPAGELISRALLLATTAHEGQLDKGGSPYIEHPKRVAASFRDEKLQVIALLHDVVEDSSTTLEDIAREFGRDIADEVGALTKRENESYMDCIRRAGRRPLARLVKLADLRDNLDLTRLRAMTPADHERAKRYGEAIAYLEGVPD